MKPTTSRQHPIRPRLSGFALTRPAIMAGASLCILPAMAQDAARLGKLEKENQELRQRLDSLETVAKKEGILPSGSAGPRMVKAMSEITLSGFVQSSYFYNSREPSDKASDGYLWNTTHNSFSINKVKLTLASKPVERSGDKWDAGFRTSLIFGEDASIVNTGGERQGLEALREAYVEANAPIGTGLNIKAGQLISLLNYESGDGGAANANFSQGYQWWYTGNGPSAGVQAGYTFTDWLDVKVRVQNGLYAGAIDGNNGKTFMGAIGIKPDDKTWLSLIGFGGAESTTMDVAGGSLLAGRKITDKFSAGFEFDYFKFDTVGTPSADLWSTGAWLGYDFNDKLGLAFRAEYLSDPDGGGIKGIAFPSRPNSAITSTDPDGELSSFTLTLNYKPVASIKIQPEIRYDRTSYTGGFDGHKDRVIFGAGVSYLF